MKWIPTLCFVAMVWLPLGACLGENPPVTPTTEPRVPMPSEDLALQVETLKPESLATAARLGPAAGATLARMARHTNPEVRAQALICLRASGGNEATPTALAALDDEDATVVVHALHVLQTFPPASDAPILAAYDRHEEERDQLALIAGLVGPRARVASWKALWLSSPPDSALGNVLLAAVARMADPDARREFSARLSSARGRDAQAWIDRAVYQADRWVLEPLSKLLDRTERAVELTPDDPTDLRPLRTCDLAANAVLILTRAKPAFPAPRSTPYDEAEMNEIRRMARQGIR